ncbi:MAG: methionine--tRNA ligase [Alphaproteobacteria bacterium]|nr:methionine--tRNA ligase [Alphaproteobacteria bacterium]MBN2675340.1 methionine--tRNA ligase [Alphaproteobacteria bacterium]
MKNKENKYLITSALPYVNGELHIGHLVGCYLPSDVYARFCRAMGRDVLFICGADEHGTPTIVGAAKEGMSIIDYNNKYLEKHLKSVNDFNLSFDLYGRTHTELQEKLIHELFLRLDEQGLIEERETIQPFSVDDDMFLADRQIEGTCPKCGYEKARGDQCDACSATYEANELKNPHSVISGGTNIEMRPTKNLFFLASKIEDKWKEWLTIKSPKWSKSAHAIAKGWANEGLRDTSITRDLSWGIPVNKPGFEHKVFYVWFDAPWGYVSISQAATNDWADWWKNNKCHYAQFMGKDNVKFHAVFFPEQQLAMNDGWKTVDMLKGLNFLNFEGAKISKSTGNGIFLETAITEAPADTWRYALMASAPETDDTDFTIQRFADIVNKDLNGILGNFVSRVCKMTEKSFENKIPANAKTNDFNLDKRINEKLSDLTTALDACEFRAAITALRSIWAIGNEFMTEQEPWTLVKNNDLTRAGVVLNECFQLIDFYARISAPFIPDTADKIRSIFKNKKDLSWPAEYKHRIKNDEEFIVPENLFARIDEEKIKSMTEKYIKQAPKIVIAKILSASAHPDSDHLQVLSVDAGDGKTLEIVCGAPNARAGLVGVLARVGATLPGFDKPLEKRKVRGIISNGMMCAADELGIGADHDGILELPDDSVIGSEFKM